jgi:hypothetical protein
MPSDIAAWLRRHRRNIGIPIVVAAFVLARFDEEYLLPAILLIGMGEALRFWAAGHLRKDKTLTTGGPYRVIRNPLYLGSFLMAVGFCLIAGSIWVWVLVILYFALCYIPVIRYEERTLREKFPADFARYSAIVPAFYPTLKIFPFSSTRFSFQQAIRNKEYNAILGILAAFALLIALRRFPF